VTASNDIDIDCKVHDLQVDYRLWNDYYGDEMLDIVLHDYYQDNGTMELTCAMYLDNSATPVYVSIPYDPKALSADKTTTISLPLSTLFDPSVHRSARFVFTPRGVAETANVNNEFTIYTGGSSDLYFTKQPEDATVQEGGNVSFEVEVAGGMKPYSYQWQVWDEKHQKWVDIRGFNGSTLSRKDIEKKWDGCKFRCVVTDAEGTQIISRVVTLTVRGIVPTGDHSNLPLYLAIAFVALALLALLRRRAKNI
jgi:MYXO-CTERM domain-containing protein